MNPKLRSVCNSLYHILCSVESQGEKEKRKNYIGSETPPTSIKEKETLWSKVPYVYPHQVRERREACLENPTTGFHTTSAGAKNKTHPPTRPKQRGQVHQPTDSGQVLTYCSTTALTQCRRHAPTGYRRAREGSHHQACSSARRKRHSECHKQELLLLLSLLGDIKLATNICTHSNVCSAASSPLSLLSSSTCAVLQACSSSLRHK